MAKWIDNLRSKRKREEKLARELSHIGSGYIPTQQDIGKSIDVGMGRMSRDVAYGEKPLAGGFDIAEVGGIPINATDFIGTGIPSKLAMGAKMFAAPLAAAIGGTAIASKGSQGAKLSALANVLRKERGVMAGVNPTKTEYELAHEVAKRNAALPIEQGGLGLPPNNTAMDRAKAMGFDTEYGMMHGGSPDITSFDMNQLGKTTRAKSAEGGIFTTDIPEQADFYAIAAANRYPFEADLKIMAKGKKWEDIANSIGVNPRSISAKDRVDFLRNHASEVGVDSMSDAADKSRYLHSGGLPEPTGGETVYPLFTRYDDPIEMQFREASQKYGGMPGIIEAAKKSNKPHLLLKNVTEGGHDALWDVHFNPSNIRSRFAAFDPMQRNSANILAGGAAGAVGLSSLADLMNQQEYQ